MLQPLLHSRAYSRCLAVALLVISLPAAVAGAAQKAFRLPAPLARAGRMDLLISV